MNKITTHINRNILDGNLMNMYLIIMEGNDSAIDDDDYTCHVYYIIIFYSYLYNLQLVWSIYLQVFSSG